MHQSVFGEFDSEKTEQVYLKMLQRMTIEQRWRAVAEMRQIAIEMVRAGVRAAHPEWNDRQIRWEATRQIMKAHGTTIRADRSLSAGD
jgi:hypothetical protein